MISIKGKNNKVIITKKNKQFEFKTLLSIYYAVYVLVGGGLSIKIKGNNNTIIIECPFKSEKSLIELSNNNCLIELESSPCFRKAHINCRLGDKQYFKFGRGTTLSNGLYVHLSSFSSCIIGKNCMFSNNPRFWPTDGHAIYDSNGTVLNKENKPIFIGDNCWIGEDCAFTKNAYISEGTIVGMRSVVSKKFEKKHCIIAGNPARIIKGERERIFFGAEKILFNI